MNDAMMSLSLFDGVALIAVLVIGLPHGAFDAAVYALWRGDKSQQTKTQSQIDLLRFLTLYSLCAAVIVLIWLIVPLLSLAAFLAISAFHFGTGDANSEHRFHRQLQIIAHGGLVTLWLPIMHPDEVGLYFTALSGPEAVMIIALIKAMQWPWLLVIFLYGLRAMRDRVMQSRFIELLIMMIALLYLPVLAGFALYFCAVHSRRHFYALYQALIHQKKGSVWPLALGLTLASWLAGGLGLMILMRAQDFTISAIQIVFIGLAALTVPHMILVDGFYHPAKKAGKGKAIETKGQIDDQS